MSRWRIANCTEGATTAAQICCNLIGWRRARGRGRRAMVKIHSRDRRFVYSLKTKQKTLSVFAISWNPRQKINCIRNKLKLHNFFIRFRFSLAVPRTFRKSLMEFRRSHFRNVRLNERENWQFSNDRCSRIQFSLKLNFDSPFGS